MNFLTDMVERRTARIAAEYGTRSVADLKQHALSGASSYDFEVALASRTDVGIIAEVKKASPSVGHIALDRDVAAQAGKYQKGGATAVSVLTEPEKFGGSFEDLALVRDAVELPVLCKDFVVDLAQIYVARSLGADAILLMVNVLGDRLEEYLAAVHEVGMSALVEVVDETELASAHEAGARVIGVNSRDLHTLKVDRPRALEVVRNAAGMGMVVVSASGVKNKIDVEQAAAASADAVLVGEMLMRAKDPVTTLGSLTGVPRVAIRPCDIQAELL